MFLFCSISFRVVFAIASLFSRFELSEARIEIIKLKVISHLSADLQGRGKESVWICQTKNGNRTRRGREGKGGIVVIRAGQRYRNLPSHSCGRNFLVLALLVGLSWSLIWDACTGGWINGMSAP